MDHGGPDAWLAGLAEMARGMRASVRLFERETQLAHAQAAQQVRQLDTKIDDLQSQIDDVREARLHSISWQYQIPTSAAWAQPMTNTASYLRYEEAHPHMPVEPCVYHKSLRCKLLERLPEDHRLHLAREWIEKRNHIWKPCEECAASGVQSIIDKYNGRSEAGGYPK